METHSLFDGIIIVFMDINIGNYDNILFEDNLPSRLLQINHCAKGRYSYAVGDDRIIYFGKGDLCVSIYNLTKTVSDFPLGYYEGLEIFIDVDVANEHVKGHIPDFDLIELAWRIALRKFMENLFLNGERNTDLIMPLDWLKKDS